MALIYGITFILLTGTGLLFDTSNAVTSNSKFICQSRTDSLVCPAGTLIEIRSVNFGRTNAVVCSNSQSIGCYSSGRVTAFIANQCNGQNACQLTADTTTLGEDPCPSVPKYLDLQWDCNAPPTTTTTTTTTTTMPPPVVTNPPSSNKIIEPDVCHEYLVTGPNGVPDNQLTASSTYRNFSNGDYAPDRARLYNPTYNYRNGSFTNGGWSAMFNNRNQYIQVEFNSQSVIRGVVTQGRNVSPNDTCCHDHRVTRYTVEYSIDGVTWDSVKDGQGNNIVFSGNIRDQEAEVTNMFGCSIIAKYLRIRPVDWVSHISLRFDVLGCPTRSDPYGVCPSGWEERQGSNECYLITTREAKGWEEARQACRLQQGDLLVLETVAERDWILQRLNNIKLTQFPQFLYQVWIGLTNVPRQDTLDYKWLDGTPHNTAVVPWKKGMPDNYAKQEHCCEFVDSELNDVNCFSPINYICEKQKYWSHPGIATTQAPPPGSQNFNTYYTNINPVRPTQSVRSTTHLRPLTQTQRAPSTVPFFIPVPIGSGTGGNNGVQTINGNTFYTGCRSTQECLNLGIGYHQSCRGCHYYIMCTSQGGSDLICPGRYQFDSNVRACVSRSGTCTGGP